MEVDPLKALEALFLGTIYALAVNLPYWIRQSKYKAYLDQWERDHNAYYARIDEEEQARKDRERETCRAYLRKVQNDFTIWSRYAHDHDWTQQALLWLREAEELLAADNFTEMRGKVMSAENALRPAHEAWMARRKSCIYHAPTRPGYYRPHR